LLDETERVVDLLEVLVSFHPLLDDLPLLNGCFGEESSAVELILLLHSLEEYISHPTGAFVPSCTLKGHFDEHDDDLGRQLCQTLPRVVHDDFLCFIHAVLTLCDERFIFFSIFNEEGGVFEQFP